jgi:arsenate reductase
MVEDDHVEDVNAEDLAALRRATDRLVHRYETVFGPELVERYVFESYTALDRTTDPGTDLAATAVRFAEDRLAALAQSREQGHLGVPVVLFVCPYNIGRSQIAAALLAHYAHEAVDVRSAGPQPGAQVDPLVVAALAEAGIPFQDAYPKPVTDDVVRAADWIITIGRVNISVLYPGKTHLEWDIPDPGDSTLEQVRALVAELDARVQELWATIRA